jgi:hypothetical protein
VSLIPLFGPLVYLCLRPPLPESSAKITASHQPQTAIALTQSLS